MNDTGFRENISTLFSLLKVESTLVNASNELYSNRLITQDTHTDVTTHLAQPTRQRASLLLAAVGATIKASPEKEQIVLQILNTNNTKVFSFQAETNVETTANGENTHDETNQRPTFKRGVSIDAKHLSKQLEVIHEVIDTLDTDDHDGLLKQLEIRGECCESFQLSSPIIAKERIQSLRAKVTKFMIPIPFIGEVNAGKTTIINALLGGKYLPAGLKRTTQFRTYIKHDHKVHSKPCGSPPCEACPRLFQSLQETNLLVSGTENQIHDEVMKRSREAIEKKNGKTSNPSSILQKQLIIENLVLVLNVNIPFFCELSLHPSLTPYLVDCCGVEWVEQDTQGFLSVTSSLIAVLNFKDMDRQNLETANVISLIKGSSNLEKIFAVTQFDAFYDDSNCSSSDTALSREHCIKNLEAVIGDVTERENVFFLSGKWALNSRIVQTNPRSKTVVERAWEDYTTMFGDQDVENNKTCAERVETISGIVFLENKLLQLFSQINLGMWSKQVDEDCSCLLRDTIEGGKQIQQDIAKKHQDLKTGTEKTRITLTDIYEENQKLTMWCEDKTIIEDFHKYAEEKAKAWWQGAMNSMIYVITKHISKLKDDHPNSYELAQFTTDLRNLEIKVLPEAILDLFTVDADKYITTYVDTCQFKQGLWRENRDQGIFNLTNNMFILQQTPIHVPTEEKKSDVVTTPTEVIVSVRNRPEYWNILLKQLGDISQLTIRASASKYKEKLLRNEPIDEIEAELISEIENSEEIASAAIEWFVENMEKIIITEPIYLNKIKQHAVLYMEEYQKLWENEVEKKETELIKAEKDLEQMNNDILKLENIVDQIRLVSKLEKARPC